MPAITDEKIRATLEQHWLTGIICDHEAKTDTATCFCCVWRSEPQATVKGALDAWISHFMLHLHR